MKWFLLATLEFMLRLVFWGGLVYTTLSHDEGLYAGLPSGEGGGTHTRGGGRGGGHTKGWSHGLAVYPDRKSTRLNASHKHRSRIPSSA